jgi:hypothetical protein
VEYGHCGSKRGSHGVSNHPKHVTNNACEIGSSWCNRLWTDHRGKPSPLDLRRHIV